VPSIFFLSLGLKLILLGLESLPKTRFLLDPVKCFAEEETAGIFSLSLFAWLNPLIIKGYRLCLSIDDLYPVSHDMSSASVASQLEATWEYGTWQKGKSYALFIAMGRAFWLPLSLPMIPKLFLVALNLAQPLLVDTTINFVKSIEDKPKEFGYSLIGAFGLTYLGIAVRHSLKSKHNAEH
jgi:hypothetical protein